MTSLGVGTATRTARAGTVLAPRSVHGTYPNHKSNQRRTKLKIGADTTDHYGSCTQTADTMARAAADGTAGTRTRPGRTPAQLSGAAASAALRRRQPQTAPWTGTRPAGHTRHTCLSRKQSREEKRAWVSGAAGTGRSARPREARPPRPTAHPYKTRHATRKRRCQESSISWTDKVMPRFQMKLIAKVLLTATSDSAFLYKHV